MTAFYRRSLPLTDGRGSQIPAQEDVAANGLARLAMVQQSEILAKAEGNCEDRH